MYLSKSQAIGLIILMFGEEHAREKFNEAEVARAKELLFEKGLRFGLCDRCRDPWWLFPTTCNSKGKTCVKYLCGSCKKLYFNKARVS